MDWVESAVQCRKEMGFQILRLGYRAELKEWGNVAVFQSAAFRAILQ